MKKITFAAIIALALLVVVASAQTAGPPEYRVYLPLVTRGRTMRMMRFGSTWAGAYTFTDVLMEDSWQSQRPPVVQKVSGADGAFDFYGDNNNPIAPVVATKKFGITATTSAAIEDALITLRAATIAADRTKLWWLDRDGSTQYWSWAKCTAINTVDSYKEKGRWLKVVTLTFYMSEGVWYGAVHQNESGSTVSGDDTVTITNAGNINAIPDRLSIVSVGGALSNDLEFRNTTISPEAYAKRDVELATGYAWDLDATKYEALLWDTVPASSDDYANLTLGSTQVMWMWFEPGANSVEINVFGDASTYNWAIDWWDRYVF